MRDSEFKADLFGKTAAQWTALNPHLPKNDLGVETDTGKMKLGAGQLWSATSYLPPVDDPAAVKSLPAGITGAAAITNVVTLSQANYDALTPVATTLYVVTPNP